MSNEVSSDTISREEMMSALFAHMVVQQSNMALMLLGKMPHPQTGESIKDLEAAKLFIDQLEMLEEKTRGNLTAQEQQLLKQSLMTLRLAFVEAVEGQPAAEKSSPSPTPESGPAEPSQSSPAEDENRKKFSKKY